MTTRMPIAVATLVVAALVSPVAALEHADLEPVESATPRVPSPLTLGWCMERASAANPSIDVASGDASAARHRARPAGALEDPRFGYEASNIPVGRWDFDSTPLSGHQLALAQKLPFPGLLGRRRDAARHGAEAAGSQLEDRRLQVAAGVEHAWATLGLAQRALEITERNLELMRQLSRIAEAKYRVGTGAQQDVLRAQVRLTELLQEQLRWRAAVESAEGALAALLDLSPDVELPRTDELATDAPAPALEPLLHRLEEQSPLLAALAARIEEAASRRGAEVLAGYPDFDVGVGYRIRANVPGDPVEGDDFVFAGVKLRLPLDRGKWRARVAEQAALLRRARAQYREARAELRDRVRAAHAELERAERTVSLIDSGLLPQARQSLASSRSGYEVDEVDFLSLVDSQLSLLDAELSLVRASAARRTAFAALEAAVGEPLR